MIVAGFDRSRKKLRTKLLATLARREHSRYELEMKAKQHAPEIVREVLDELAADNWQSDERFAEELARSYCSRGYGVRRVQYELCRHRIASDIMESVTALPESDWLDSCRRVYCKKYSDTRITVAECQRRVRFLVQRGYPVSLAEEVLAWAQGESLDALPR